MDNQHKDYSEPNDRDEPVILSFESFKKTQPQPDGRPPQPTNEDQPQDDDFWAGRSLAMRRSARWAA